MKYPPLQRRKTIASKSAGNGCDLDLRLLGGRVTRRMNNHRRRPRPARARGRCGGNGSISADLAYDTSGSVRINELISVPSQKKNAAIAERRRRLSIT
jgi:hypothetical protein